MSNNPSLRFLNFKIDWKNISIEKSAELKQGFPFDSKTYSLKGNFNIITISNVGGDRYIRHITECNKVQSIPKSLQEHQQLKDNDILISMTGNVGRVSLNIGKNNLLNQRVGVLIPYDNVDPNFLYNILSSYDFEKKMIMAGKGAAQLNISNNDIYSYEYNYPTDKNEQNKIATFLSNVDLLLEEKKKELEKTKNFKKSMLSKMFPQGVSKVPEIRFNGFNDNWNYTSLDAQNAVFLKGYGYSKNDLSPKGIPLFLYGRLYTKYETTVKSIDTYTSNILRGSLFSDGNEIVVPSSGETSEDIARASAILSQGIILGGGLNIFRLNKNFDNRFIALLITYGDFYKELTKKAQGKTVVHIYNDDLKDIPFYYPGIGEQKMIADYFDNIHELQQNQEKEITVLEHLKSTLLSKMFA